MSTDLRGFRFPLEPLQRRQTWQLEALQHRIARKHTEVAQAETALAAMRVRLTSVHDEVTRNMAQRLAPDLHRHHLLWLAHLRQDMHTVQLALEQRQRERSALLAELRQRQAALQVIEQHRQDCVGAYALDEERRQAAVADQEWMARSTVAHEPR